MLGGGGGLEKDRKPQLKNTTRVARMRGFRAAASSAVRAIGAFTRRCLRRQAVVRLWQSQAVLRPWKEIA
jgi:hypothetical protein